MVVAQTIGNYQSSKSSFKTWLLGIARHKLADHRRSVYRQPIDQSDE
jgi:DNA-directed RNA polymerase specialized sigma24 family protein